MVEQEVWKGKRLKLRKCMIPFVRYGKRHLKYFKNALQKMTEFTELKLIGGGQMVRRNAHLDDVLFPERNES